MVVATGKLANFAFTLCSLLDKSLFAGDDQQGDGQKRLNKMSYGRLLPNEGKRKAPRKVVWTVDRRKSSSGCHDRKVLDVGH